MVKRVQVGRSAVAFVDDEDFARVSRHRWYAHRKGHQTYARAEFRVGGKKVRILMHRVVLGLRPGEIGDHRDGDGLNNRRGNLRRATHTENMRNRAKRKFSETNPYKGVHKRQGVWVAMIKLADRQHAIGIFDDAESAARAYDVEATKHFGEFARLNFATVAVK